MTAVEKAKRKGWDVDPTQNLNPTGIIMGAEIRMWNTKAAQQAEKIRARSRDARRPQSQ